MKKILLSLLAVIVVLGLFAVAGYAGYRLGYVQGVQSKTTAGSPSTSNPNPLLRPFNNFNFGSGMHQAPTRRFRSGRGFRRGVPVTGFGFGVFALFVSLARVAVLIAIFLLVIGFIYWLLTRTGWRLTRVAQTSTTPPPPSSESVGQDTETKL